MKLTEQQQAFIEACKNETEHLVLLSCAGSGKTSTMEFANRAILAEAETTGAKPDIVNCAFNASIAKVLAQRMPEGTINKTLHSLCYGAMRKMLDANIKAEVDDQKGRKIAKKVGAWGKFPGFMQALGLAKAAGMIPQDCKISGKSLPGPDTDEWWRELIDAGDIDTGTCSNPIELLRKGLLYSIERAFLGSIDFDDMLYMPVVFGAPFSKFDYVFVDEAQDLSPIQLEAVTRMLKPKAGRLIAVGDPHQAIYAFRGADHTSIDNIIRRFNCKVMNLSQSFRCPKTIVLEAQTIVSHIEATDDAVEGSVVSVGNYNASSFVRTDAILCRNTAPLITLCLQLLSDGVGACVRGRDIGRSLKGMVSKSRGKDLKELRVDLTEWVGEKIEQCYEFEQYNKAHAWEDRLRCLTVIIASMKSSDTPEALKLKIETLFDEKDGVVTLSTIHRSKGLEWPRVFFLDRELIPSRFAKTEAAVQQEMNLAYVAITRAREQLIYISSGGYQTAEPQA